MVKTSELISSAPFLCTVFGEPRFRLVTLKHVKSLPGAELNIEEDEEEEKEEERREPLRTSRVRHLAPDALGA